ncbi:MAG: hypothetical protein ACRC6E_14435 [Fusobacteriaceae bacterium]
MINVEDFLRMLDSKMHERYTLNIINSIISKSELPITADDLKQNLIISFMERGWLDKLDNQSGVRIAIERWLKKELRDTSKSWRKKKIVALEEILTYNEINLLKELNMDLFDSMFYKYYCVGGISLARLKIKHRTHIHDKLSISALKSEFMRMIGKLLENRGIESFGLEQKYLDLYYYTTGQSKDMLILDEYYFRILKNDRKFVCGKKTINGLKHILTVQMRGLLLEYENKLHSLGE